MTRRLSFVVGQIAFRAGILIFPRFCPLSFHTTARSGAIHRRESPDQPLGRAAQKTQKKIDLGTEVSKCESGSQAE
jgi:hypothetical protein